MSCFCASPSSPRRRASGAADAAPPAGSSARLGPRLRGDDGAWENDRMHGVRTLRSSRRTPGPMDTAPPASTRSIDRPQPWVPTCAGMILGKIPYHVRHAGRFPASAFPQEQAALRARCRGCRDRPGMTKRDGWRALLPPSSPRRRGSIRAKLTAGTATSAALDPRLRGDDVRIGARIHVRSPGGRA